MKKSTLTIVAISAMAFFCACNSGNGQKAVQTPEVTEEPEAPAVPADPYAACPKVFAKAYDGFVNIRQAPDAKSAVVGQFRNGPQGAAQLGIEGNWTKIAYFGTEGYVSSAYLSSTPTPEVTVDISSGWLYGSWRYKNSPWTGYTINKNGTYNYECYGGSTYFYGSGVWRLEGSEIVFVETKINDELMKGSSSTREKLNDQARIILGMERGGAVMDDNSEDGL